MRFTTVLTGLLTAVLFFSGCDDEEESQEDTSATAGWHFQGRDCLACHNYDLGKKRALVVAASVFLDQNVTDIDNIDALCGAETAIEFLDGSYNVVLSSASYKDEDSKGYSGKGNAFLLSRRYNQTLNGSYYVRIVDTKTRITITQSQYPHNFSAAPYDIDRSIDYANRLSCNACHNGEEQSRLFAKNRSVCQ